MISQSTVGRTTVGASWQSLSGVVLYLIPITIPADRLLANIAAHIRHSVANVPALGGYVYADNAGAPGDLMAMTGHASTAMLATSTGRWFHFPIDLWFPTSTDVWIGIAKIGNQSIDLAFDAAGGSGGTRVTFSDVAAWTPGTNDWSIHGVLFG